MSNKTYKVRIAANDETELTAMDIAGYSHMTPAKHGTRFVIFVAQNKTIAQENVASALGNIYRPGTHQVINA